MDSVEAPGARDSGVRRKHALARCRPRGLARSQQNTWPRAGAVSSGAVTSPLRPHRSPVPAREVLHLRLMAGDGELHICLVGN